MITFHTAKSVHAINVFLGSDVRHESQFPSDVDREEWEEEQKVTVTCSKPNFKHGILKAWYFSHSPVVPL